MLSADGNKYSIYPIYFGNDGQWNSWIMGRVIEAVQDKKGLVRQVKIKTKTSCLDRPVTKICLLQEAGES